MLGMRDRDFGWTIEMQVKALRYGLRCGELPVSYRKRTHGNSKVGGTLKGTVLAGYKILGWVLVEAVLRRGLHLSQFSGRGAQKRQSEAEH